MSHTFIVNIFILYCLYYIRCLANDSKQVTNYENNWNLEKQEKKKLQNLYAKK